MSQALHPALQLLNRISLVTQIVIGLLAGIALAYVAPQAALSVGFIGNVFVSALKAVAPILVFILVMASIANHQHGQQTHIRPILLMYLLGTFSVAVIVDYHMATLRSEKACRCRTDPAAGASDYGNAIR